MSKAEKDLREAIEQEKELNKEIKILQAKKRRNKEKQQTLKFQIEQEGNGQKSLF